MGQKKKKTFVTLRNPFEIQFGSRYLKTSNRNKKSLKNTYFNALSDFRLSFTIVAKTKKTHTKYFRFLIKKTR